jgi:hypothetical protein
MPRIHPKNIAPSVIQAGQFSMQDNPDMLDIQANKTYLVEATDGQALGSDGRTKAVAKAKRDNFNGEDQQTEELRVLTATLFKDFSSFDKKGNEMYGGAGGMSADGNLGGDRGMLTRQVASYQADQLLGLNSVSEEKFGVDRNGKVYGLSVQADGQGLIGSKGILDIDYSDPRIQKGLSDLEVSDYITGQMDRNPRNIFVDPTTGKVTGIDNDMAFPEVSRDQVFKRDGAIKEKVVNGVPSVMHRGTAEKILQADPEELRAKLSNMPIPKGGSQPLSRDAIDGAVNRLIELQSELRKDNGSKIQVVEVFNRQTYDATLNKQKQNYNDISKDGDWNDIDNLGESKKGFAVGTLKAADKSSYLGSLIVEMKMNECLGSPQQLVQYTGQKAAKLDPDVQRLAEGYRRMSPNEKAAFDKKFADVSKMERQLERKLKHLEKPSALDRFKSLFKGSSAVMEQKKRHADELTDLIKNADADLMKMAENRLPPRPKVNEGEVLRQNNVPKVGEKPKLSQEESNLLEAFQKLPTEQQEQMRQRSNSLDISNEEIDRLLKEMEIDSLPNVDGNTPSLVSPESQNERGVISAKMPTENGIKTMPREEFLEKLKKQQNDEEYHDQNLGEGNMELNEIDEESRLLIEELNKKNGNVQKQQPHTLDHSHSVESMTGLVKHGETHESEGLNVGKKKVGQIIHRSDSSPHLGGHKL